MIQMAGEGIKRLTVPAFTYRGFTVPALTLGEDLIASIDSKEPAYKLASLSAPLATRIALYTVGLDGEIGEPSVRNLPEAVREGGTRIYEDARQRKKKNTNDPADVPVTCWHKDGVYLLPRSETPKCMLQPEDPRYVLAKYFKDVDGFEERGGIWQIRPTSDTTELFVWLPRGDDCFVVPTKDGVYHPVTGTPFETVLSKNEALKRWMSAGLTKEQAEEGLTRFYRARPSEIAVVDSFSDGYSGEFAIEIVAPPSSVDATSGFFNVR
jgi:hypothetical protein